MPLREALEREGGSWGADLAREAGATAGSVEATEHGRRAERNEPRLTTHDRYGNRINTVELDPSWHWLLAGAVRRGIHGLPWREPQTGAHVVRAATFMLWSNANNGVMCPVSMTYAAVPALRDAAPELATEWEPRLTLPDYERGALAGMAMTERQGGSDVRANITRAEPAGDDVYELYGHKWFCSYPPCAVFLVLAQTGPAAALSCFLVERGAGMEFAAAQGQAWHPLAAVIGGRVPGRPGTPGGRGGTRRPRDHRAWSTTPAWIACSARPTHCGADCGGDPSRAGTAARSARSSSTSRRCAMSWPTWRSSPRRRRWWLCGSRASMTSRQRSLSPDATAVMKYWITKRAAPHAAEALECLGGNGFVEDSGCRCCIANRP